jgi:hypothetical protein
LVAGAAWPWAWACAAGGLGWGVGAGMGWQAVAASKMSKAKRLCIDLFMISLNFTGFPESSYRGRYRSSEFHEPATAAGLGQWLYWAIIDNHP